MGPSTDTNGRIHTTTTTSSTTNNNNNNKKYKNYGSVDPTISNGDKAKVGGEGGQVGWFSHLVFGWFGAMLDLGNAQEQLDPSDLGVLPLPSFLETKVCDETFQQYYYGDGHGPRRRQRQRQRQLWWALFRAYGGGFARAGLLKLVHDLLLFVGPWVLHRMIDWLNSSSSSLEEGLWLTALVTASQLVMSLCLRHYFFACYATGLQFRTAVVSAVYRKSLLVTTTTKTKITTPTNGSSSSSSSSSEIVNLVSVDAQRLQDLCSYLHAVWYSAVQISLSMVFLWKLLGVSCLGGLFVILCMVPVTKAVASVMGQAQQVNMTAKDARVEANVELLQSSKVVKLQAWEDAFRSKLVDLRTVELAQLYRYQCLNAASQMLWTSVPILVAVATFALYVGLGHVLDVATALTALALFDILRFPLFMLPRVINNLVEATVSVQRIESFLNAEEYEPVAAMIPSLSHSSPSSSPKEEPAVVVEIRNASFAYPSNRQRALEVQQQQHEEEEEQQQQQQWKYLFQKAQLEDAEAEIRLLRKSKPMNHVAIQEEEEEEVVNFGSSLLSLRRIDLQIREGELVAVVGSVGAGKSTLLQAILGELKAGSGWVRRRRQRQLNSNSNDNSNTNTTVAYAAQEPFLMNTSLRQNIVFGLPYDEVKYQRALRACALTHDVDQLPYGDDTEIGEKGITLSGGQKARVAMARAIYADADLVLFDDPLAAVDAHVGKHLWQSIQNLVKANHLQTNASAHQTKTTVILVTNALQYLAADDVDRIVVLKEGKIREQGTYQQLSSDKNTLFASYLSTLKKESVVSQTNLAALATATPTASATVTTQETKRKETTLTTTTTTDEHNKGNKENNDNEDDDDDDDNWLPLEEASESKQKFQTLSTNEFQERATGHVSLQVYKGWIDAAGGMGVGLLLVLFYMSVEAVNVASKWYLTYWSQSSSSGSSLHTQTEFLLGYALLNLVAILATFARVLLIYVCGLRASQKLFTKLLDTVLAAPMSFFDTTPVGRMVNRFSKDMYTVDEPLVQTLSMYLNTMSSVVGVVVVISYVTPLFILFLIPLILYYSLQQQYFTQTYRELKRLDSVSRSPIYALLGETLDGVSTLRAFGVQSYLQRKMTDLLNVQQNAYYLTFAGQCWLAVRLELVGTIIITFACLCACYTHVTMKGGGSTIDNETFAGLGGLSISFALVVTQSLNWSVRMASDLEAAMVAVERIRQYDDLPQEAPRHLPPPHHSSSSSWPTRGDIVFRNVWMRYRPGLPYVLKGLSLTIPAGAKVGVVGRTGAGKSSLLAALTRLVEIEDERGSSRHTSSSSNASSSSSSNRAGTIEIDGVDIRTVGLHALRSNVTVIPQDPVLFTGTVRTNLDPFQRYTTEQCTAVLASLFSSPSSSRSSSLPTTSLSLDQRVEEGGHNFSVGQRQLLVIARALLRRPATKLVIMDEATAAVDADTDQLIQTVVRTHFGNDPTCTCLTIAHRLHTVMDSDYILVMDDGRAAEFDTPSNLLHPNHNQTNHPHGLFKKLVDAWDQEQEHL